jgi:hypothetical protein
VFTGPVIHTALRSAKVHFCRAGKNAPAQIVKWIFFPFVEIIKKRIYIDRIRWIGSGFVTPIRPFPRT